MVERIIAALGGNRFLAMTGAKNLIDHGQGLSMTIPASMTKGRINRVRITLEPSDTYSVEIGRFRSP